MDGQILKGNATSGTAERKESRRHRLTFLKGIQNEGQNITKEHSWKHAVSKVCRLSGHRTWFERGESYVRNVRWIYRRQRSLPRWAKIRTYSVVKSKNLNKLVDAGWQSVRQQIPKLRTFHSLEMKRWDEVKAKADFTIPYTVRVLHGLKLRRDLSIHKVDQDASWTSVAEMMISGQSDMDRAGSSWGGGA